VEPGGILTFDWQGNVSSFSPELIGQHAPAFDDFVFCNPLRDGPDALHDSVSFRTASAAIARGVERCRRDCGYFGLCGGGAPANELCELGTLEGSETLYCRMTKQNIQALNGDDDYAKSLPVYHVGQEKARLLIEGGDLWRSTMVTLGSQRADEILVLPNMRGIIATFKKIEQPSRPEPCSVFVPIRVWTSEGVTMDDSAQAQIYSTDKRGNGPGCPGYVPDSSRKGDKKHKRRPAHQGRVVQAPGLSGPPRPVGRLVVVAVESARVHAGLGQRRGEAPVVLPVRRHAPRRLPRRMAGQVRDTRTGEDQKVG